MTTLNIEALFMWLHSGDLSCADRGVSDPARGCIYLSVFDYTKKGLTRYIVIAQISSMVIYVFFFFTLACYLYQDREAASPS